jgi:uncharacterized protein YdcH (DUF465 family)
MHRTSWHRNSRINWKKISDLKQADGHFSQLIEECHEVNRTIHRAETRVEPMDDLHEAELIKKRCI